MEPAIGHLKADHRLDRCWLKGSEGDAPHAVLCAAGFNIRRLLRAIVRLGMAGLFLALTLLIHIGQQINAALANNVCSPRYSARSERFVFIAAGC